MIFGSVLAHKNFSYFAPSITWAQEVNWTYIRCSEDVLDIFQTSYIRQIYVLCSGSKFLRLQTYQKIFPPSYIETQISRI